MNFFIKKFCKLLIKVLKLAKKAPFKAVRDNNFSEQTVEIVSLSCEVNLYLLEVPMKLLCAI